MRMINMAPRKKHFYSIIEALNKDPKYKKSPSRANDFRTKTGDFLSIFYPSPTVPRDQLVIDTFNKFSEKPENKKTEIYAIGAVMAGIKSFQNSREKIVRTKRELGDDLSSLNLALDSFMNDFEPKYSQIMDPKNGLINQIQDKELRKKLAKSLIEMKEMIEAELPKDYKAKRTLETPRLGRGKK
jgi:hypothetical protein